MQKTHAKRRTREPPKAPLVLHSAPHSEPHPAFHSALHSVPTLSPPPLACLLSGFGPFRAGGVVLWPCVLAPAVALCVFFVLAYRLWSDEASCFVLWLTAGYFVCAVAECGGGAGGARAPCVIRYPLRFLHLNHPYSLTESGPVMTTLGNH